ncbi:hypothetical protein A0H76_3020 [Hepatospora eriocheir]|uniref:Uncharacterized protein n=1 Tax=Hepatospora eriocheir TaxID=1081669 RepID=A0A1X0QIN3_9MICR|nr:hypothetical protein A0H76_3020 [Hepatospora eriocheir]
MFLMGMTDLLSLSFTFIGFVEFSYKNECSVFRLISSISVDSSTDDPIKSTSVNSKCIFITFFIFTNKTI